MGFQFSLATVLRLRESAERREELNLQRLLAKIARVREAIELETRRIEDARTSRDLVLRQPKSVVAYELHFLDTDAEIAADRREALREQLALLEQQRQPLMKSYETAHLNRKMLSDMAARERDAYHLRQSRAEQKMLDDIFATRGRLK